MKPIDIEAKTLGRTIWDSRLAVLWTIIALFPTAGEGWTPSILIAVFCYATASYALEVAEWFTPKDNAPAPTEQKI